MRLAITVKESIRNGLSDRHKISIAETQSNAYINLQKVLIQQNRSDAALEIAERARGRAFAELLASRLSNKTIPEIQKIAQAPTLDEIRRIAKTQNATLVEYAFNDEFLYIWVIKPNGNIAFKSTSLKNIDLAKLVQSNRESIGVRASIAVESINKTPPNAINTNLEQLHKLLIEPIKQDLPTDQNDSLRDGKAERIIFIPQGPLFLVPFPALKDPSGKYLIEQHTISTAPSIQTLTLTHEKRKPPSNQNPLIVGNPTMPDSSLPPLPGAEREALAIAKRLNTQALTGNQATKSEILKRMKNASIIHLATHGLLNTTLQGDIPGAIALAPSPADKGFLTSSELFDLRLDANLVVLSACDTGRGEITGDGVIGLSRSFIAAGVPSIVVSLWAIKDNSTSELMSEFYSNLQTNPNKAQALRQAMLTTMKTRPAPIDWAAFTLIGEAE